MAPPSFVFVESNTTGTGALFASAARDRGVRPLLLASDPDRYPFVADLRLDVMRVDTTDCRALSDAVREMGREGAIAGVYSSSEYFAETAAHLAKELRLAGADPAAVARCRHKPTQRRCLEAAGVPVPRFVQAHSASEACEAARSIGLPVVLKPGAGSGSVGVRLCQTMDEVRAHASRLCAAGVNERGLPAAADLLVEEHITGQEYSVESFGTVAIGITRKLMSPPPYFVEWGHDFPCDPGDPDDLREPCDADADGERITRVALDALAAVNLQWGPAHTELRLGPRGPVIMEINPRLAGGFIPELVRLSTGVDLIERTIALACGERVSLAPRDDRRASIRFLVPGVSAPIAAVNGVAEARGLAGVHDVRLYRTPPFEHSVTHDFRDRIGHVITAGARGEPVPALAERALASLSVEVGSVEMASVEMAQAATAD